MSDTEPYKSCEERVAHLKGEVPDEVLAVLVALMKVFEEGIKICPHCGTKLTDMRQVGRSVYAGCGCRLYQGLLPEKWRRQLDRVEIRVPVEKMPWWERILYWIVTRF